MATYHFCVKQISRGAGQSATASASYRSGEKMMDEYYGQIHDYSHKKGIVHTEILLPENAPEEYTDRQTLWNAVERFEKHPRAQLAYSFDIALQNEFSMEENISMARAFVKEQFVAKGMIADLAVHVPENDGGNPNPHFHVMTTMRPILPDGSFGPKQRRQYLYDEEGEPVLDEKGKHKFDAVSTTGWSTPEQLEDWRKKWAEKVNREFEKKGLDVRIDHRSYMRQGIDQLPTIHEGPRVRAMEKRGIKTEKGEWNNFIRSANAMVKVFFQKVQTLITAIGELRKEYKELASKSDNAPGLVDLMQAGQKQSLSAKNSLKFLAEDVAYLREREIHSINDLGAYLKEIRDEKYRLKEKMDTCKAEIKELQDLKRMLDFYKQTKPVYEQAMAKRFGKKAFMQEHERQLEIYHMAERKLKAGAKKYGKISAKSIKERTEKLNQEYKACYADFGKSRAEVEKLNKIRYSIERGLQARKAAPHRGKRQER